MTVKKILREWLIVNGCDGLCHPGTECRCGLDDFMPCGYSGIECVAARKGSAPDGAEFTGDWMHPVDMEGEHGTN